MRVCDPPYSKPDRPFRVDIKADGDPGGGGLHLIPIPQSGAWRQNFSASSALALLALKGSRKLCTDVQVTATVQACVARVPQVVPRPLVLSSGRETEGGGLLNLPALFVHTTFHLF
jgi:hypothetical protein